MPNPVRWPSDSNPSSTCPSQTNDNTVKGNTLTDSGGTVRVNIFVTTGVPSRDKPMTMW